jgi:hypothetical protein
MDAGLVVVSAVLGVFLAVPLVLAWVSTNPRRWARVEGVLGREPGGEAPRWVWWLGSGVSGVYTFMGAGLFLGGENRLLGAMWVLQGLTWGLLVGYQYRVYRRRRAAETSAQTQVEGRAEPGRPGTGG